MPASPTFLQLLFVVLCYTLDMSTSPDYSLDDQEKAVYSYEDAEVAREIDAAPDLVMARRFGRLGLFLSRLFASGIESHGVERVPENQRESKNAWNKCVFEFQFARVPVLSVV
jgi:hypothetical protein